jgi:hypothetical protein
MPCCEWIAVEAALNDQFNLGGAMNLAVSARIANLSVTPRREICWSCRMA